VIGQPNVADELTSGCTIVAPNVVSMDGDDCAVQSEAAAKRKAAAESFMRELSRSCEKLTPDRLSCSTGIAAVHW
jgi:uncharacterized protein YfcZ (UPF0381/DUF406 family)